MSEPKLHRIEDLRRSYISCACGGWSLKLDRSCTLHGAERVNHLIDSWLRHKAEQPANAQDSPSHASAPE